MTIQHRTLICLLTLCLAVHSASAELRYDVAWKTQGNLGFFGPNEIRDADNGRTLGIVVCEVGSGIACFTPDGKRMWSYPLKPPVTAPPAVGDLNGDGTEEIVACDAQGAVVALDAKGNRIWLSHVHASVQAESAPVIADLDGDGRPEILIGDLTGALSCLDHTGTFRWRFSGDGGQMGPPLVADIYDRPGKEIIVTSHDRHIYALTADGRWLWDLYMRNDLFPNSTPMLADVEGDGIPELYIGGGLHHFYRIDLKTHRIALEENVLMHVNNAICATDLDGDGKDEVLFGNKGGVAYCYGHEGFRWKRELPAGSLSAPPVAVNLDDDPDLEVLFAFDRLQAFDADGTVLLDTTPPARLNSPMLAGDFDNDGQLDTIVAAYGSLTSNTLAYLRWNVPYRENPRHWRVYAGTRAHTCRTPGAREYDPLPTPQRSAANGQANVSPRGELRLFTGANRWRFDIANPREKRLVLLTEVRGPDQNVRRFVRHVRAKSSRITIDLDVRKTGTYQVTQTLMDADGLGVLSSETREISYRGLAGDKQYMNEVLFRETANLLKPWRASNPQAAGHLADALQSLRGRLLTLNEDEKDFDAGDVFALRQRAQRLRSLSKAGAELAPTGSFFVWEFCPWAYFDARETLPGPQDRTDELRAAACVGEYESLALNVTNMGPRTLDVRVVAGDMTGTKTYPAGDHLSFRHAVTVPTLRGQRVADALPRLDQGQLLRIASGETEQLWITINATALEPGDYVSDLRLESVEPDATRIDLPLRLRVHDLKLPRPRPLRFCVWSGNASMPEYERTDLVEHGVTVHFGNSPTATCDESGALVGKMDFTAHDASVQRLAEHGMILFIGSQGSLGGQPFLSEPWRKAFVEYLRTWVAHMKEIGLEYEGWALYPYDEPSTPYGQVMRNLVEVAGLIRQADPNIRIYADPTSGTTMESVRRLSGLIDIWCPSSELLERLGEKLIPEAKRVGKEVWFYDAAGHAKTLSSLGLYRRRFWYAWNHGFTGVGWWTYAYGDHQWQESNPMGDFYDTAYRVPGGIVPSKRWEAAREGVEDYEILTLLREALRRAETARVAGPVMSRARELLQAVPRKVERTLREVGRRLPLRVDSVATYQSATDMLQQTRLEIIETCLRLKEKGK